MDLISFQPKTGYLVRKCRNAMHGRGVPFWGGRGGGGIVRTIVDGDVFWAASYGTPSGLLSTALPA